MHKASNNVVWNEESTGKPCKLSTNKTKQQQTRPTASDLSESTNPSAPLPRSEAFVMISRIKDLKKRECVKGMNVNVK
jgi:hypothetical protein